MVWLWRTEVGAVALCLCAVIVRLMVREARTLMRECVAEDWLLLAGSLATAGRIAIMPWTGPVGTRWVWIFAVTCAMYLIAKGLRATRVEN